MPIDFFDQNPTKLPTLHLDVLRNQADDLFRNVRKNHLHVAPAQRFMRSLLHPSQSQHGLHIIASLLHCQTFQPCIRKGTLHPLRVRVVALVPAASDKIHLFRPALSNDAEAPEFNSIHRQTVRRRPCGNLLLRQPQRSAIRQPLSCLCRLIHCPHQPVEKRWHVVHASDLLRLVWAYQFGPPFCHHEHQWGFLPLPLPVAEIRPARTNHTPSCFDWIVVFWTLTVPFSNTACSAYKLLGEMVH